MSDLRTYEVRIHGVLAGRLLERDGHSQFEFVRTYREMVDRPVLGQHFEDDLEKVRRGRRYRLPPFFANLVPEGEELRRILERSLGVPRDDDLALLAAVGGDLPGAVEIRAAESHSEGEEPFVESDPPDVVIAEEAPRGLRFSLAGAQLKFSVLLDADKLTLPASDQQGDWIVKLESPRFRGLVENEYSTMEWARAAGFQVPECRLLHNVNIANFPGRARSPVGALAVRRFDREGSRLDSTRIHQEDLAQVVGALPTERYEVTTYEKIARLISVVIGDDAALEFVRRLVFVVLSGNCDAHLKNWSLIYPDRRTPVLAPMYDQVSTIAWAEVERKLSLKMVGQKNPFQVDRLLFTRLGQRAGLDPAATEQAVDEALSKLGAAWRVTEDELPWPKEHRRALAEYWSRLPLAEGLKSFGR